MTQPQFDDFDKGILSVCVSNRRSLKGPLVGDFIKRKDGLFARITHLHDDIAQTNDFSATGEGGSFYMTDSGHMSYSGGLQPGEKRTHLDDSRTSKDGSAWFFHHGRSEAHNGVNFQVRCKVWDLLEDAEAIDRSKPARLIADKDTANFRGSVQTSTYTTFDGVERVAYNDNKTLADYLAENPGLKVYNEEEIDVLFNKYYASLVTEPQEITEEQYNYYLEVLPPCRWNTHSGITFFHVSERLTGNLVQWCAKKGARYYGFTDDASLSREALVAKFSTSA